MRVVVGGVLVDDIAGHHHVGLERHRDIGVGGPGDPAYETFRLAWPATRTGAAAVGLTEDDLRCVNGAFANSPVLVGVTIFAAWGQLPRPSDKRSSHM
ncbi:MAG: hypothetical protein JWR37_3923 [Mycobacterium sp.]|nr:hypothetical protein [Mycobacterium sp.]